ncbi:MHYT domain-containing protein [Streptomyces sp. NPDC093223]|uniref:MHYT domain-containing protein n=1 Tax=Streptomyces sp. NPDC093223 TaxID=3366033 RepID=UPI0038215670
MHGVSDGTISMVASYLVALLGSALGLRCVVRSVRYGNRGKPGWLALGAAATGSGVWMMHFITMVDFSPPGATITFDVRRTVASLVIAIVVMGIGMFLVGYGGARPAVLGLSGTVIGLGVAATHYLGIAAIYVNAIVQYRAPVVIGSVVVAVGAATAALWSAVSKRGLLSSLIASVVMTVTIVGVHHIAMASLVLHVQPQATSVVQPGSTGVALLPLLIGPGFFLLLAMGAVLFDPLILLGASDWGLEPSAPPPPPSENQISDVYLTYPPARR